MTGERTYAVAGAKGGVGKTTTAINLGSVFAANGYETVVVELDLPMANIVDFVDIDVDVHSSTTLYDVLASDGSITDAVYEVSPRFSVVPSGTDIGEYANTDLDGFPEVATWLTQMFDIVLFDTPAGLTRETVEPVRIASEILLVSTPRVASVRNAGNTLEIAERLETVVSGLVLTKSGTGRSPGAERIAEFLGVDLLGHVPEDDAIPHSQDRGEPVVTHAPDSGAAIAYHRIATQLVDADLSRAALRDVGRNDGESEGGRDTGRPHPAAQQTDGGPAAEPRRTESRNAGKEQAFPESGDRDPRRTEREPTSESEDHVAKTSSENEDTVEEMSSESEDTVEKKSSESEDTVEEMSSESEDTVEKKSSESEDTVEEVSSENEDTVEETENGTVGSDGEPAPTEGQSTPESETGDEQKTDSSADQTPQQETQTTAENEEQSDSGSLGSKIRSLFGM